MSQTLNPRQIPSAGAAHGVPTPSVAVTSTQAGTLTSPQGFTSGWTVVSNASPWLMTVTGAEGSKTILPYTADLVVPVAVGIPFKMSPPPGPAIAAANPWVQGDWYIAGGGPPSGTFPYPLTSQAISASLLALPAASSATSGFGSGTEAIFNFTATARLMTVRLNFVTGAGAGNRFVTLACFDGPNGTGNHLWDSGPNLAQGASLSFFYSFYGATVFTILSGGPPVAAPIPPNFIVNSGWSLITVTSGLQLTDDYQTMVVTTASS